MVVNEATQQYILTHLHDDVRALALKGCADPQVDVAFALQQISGRQQIKNKLPLFYNNMRLVLPVRLSLEQCSSEETSAFKAQLIKGNHLADLTGGFGIDTLALSQQFKKVDYIERNSELCEIVTHNMQVLNKTHINCHNEDGIEYISKHPEADVIYLDPARRDKMGGKVAEISDCEPDITAHLTLLTANERHVWVKLSPMFDLHAALSSLPVCEAYVISVKNECKELLLHLHKPSTLLNETTQVHAVELNKDTQESFNFTIEEERSTPITIADSIGAYLYEPGAALMKAGCFKLYAHRLGLLKLDTHSHLYTSQQLSHGAHYGKCFQVIDCFSFNKPSIKALRTQYPQCNITTRNFPMTPEALRKKLGIKEGGDHQLFATTLQGNHILIVGKRLQNV